MSRVDLTKMFSVLKKCHGKLDCFVNEMLLIRERKPTLNTQSDSIRANVFIYGLESVVSVLFTNTRTRWPHNEPEIFNTARGVAECSIENFQFIVLPGSKCVYL